MASDLDDMQAMVDATLAYLGGDADPEPRQVTNVASILMGVADASADAGRAVAYGGPGRALATVRPVAFRRALENLVDNGVRYGARVRIALAAEETALVLRIDDDGPGIRPEAFDKIFERFYTDRPEHGFGQNSGLGLSISKQIVEAHRGKLWAENRTAVPTAEDEAPRVLGARFTLRLPTV